VKPAGRPWERWRTGGSYTGEASRAATRTPGGHPEGYLEAFANVYRDFMADIRRVNAGESPQRDYPGIEEGLRSMRFVTAAVASSTRGAAWISV